MNDAPMSVPTLQRIAWWDMGPGKTGSMWTDGEHVWRLNAVDADALDTEGRPMGLRWESSVTHWARYKAVMVPEGASIDG